MIAEATAVPGYVATLQVRMLHAHMRKLALDRGVGTARHGLPINQIDLGRTWIDFTLTAFTAEEAFGFALSSLETTDLYRDWWYFGHLLGVDLRLIQGDHRQRCRGTHGRTVPGRQRPPAPNLRSLRKPPWPRPPRSPGSCSTHRPSWAARWLDPVITQLRNDREQRRQDTAT